MNQLSEGLHHRVNQPGDVPGKEYLEDLIHPIKRFYTEWFLGSAMSGSKDIVALMLREVGMCRDMNGGSFTRSPYPYEGFVELLNSVDLLGTNLFIGIGFWLMNLDHAEENMYYDRVVYDVDCEDDPGRAVDCAHGFVEAIEARYGVDCIVVSTGFKGVHVYVPLAKPVKWDSYRLIWGHLYGYFPKGCRGYVDKNMLQWNRLDRVPMTFNIKGGVKRFAKVVYPDLDFKGFSWSRLRLLDPSMVEVVKPVIDVAVPKAVGRKFTGKDARGSWINKVVERGLPDGRKRFMLMVLIPYLSVAKNMKEDEVVKVCREFLDNSCRNHGKCDKVYDSWIKSVVRSSVKKGFRGFGLSKLGERDPELFRMVQEAVR